MVNQLVEENLSSFSHRKTNQKVLELITKNNLNNKLILDVGAGQGYFASILGNFLKKMYAIPPSEMLRACDLHPEQFKYGEIACDRVNVHNNLPYFDETFDFTCSIEVIEHIENQFDYIRELYRITRENGRVIITTPNILNINSRIKYLASGFWLLFDPLPIDSTDPVHLGGHIHPVSFYYLTYILKKAGFQKINLHFDRIKKSGSFLSCLWFPMIYLLNRQFVSRFRKKYPEVYRENRDILNKVNRFSMLSSRTIIIEAIK